MKKIIFVLLAVIALAANAFAHEHHAPHKGVLIVLGEEFAHLELVLDSDTGTLSAYSLDGEAENALPLVQKEILFKISPEKDAPVFELSLKAVENPLTGEVAGNTSEFSAQVDALKGVSKFTGTITEVTTKGQKFRGVSFNYPEGNDHDDDKGK